MPVYHQRLSKLMLDFSRISNFPNTTVAIDGTHIRIKSLSVDEHLYVNRKGYHSNVQGPCDSDLIFLNVVAKWPGGTYDSHIWRFFSIHDYFENGTIINRRMATRRQWISIAPMATDSFIESDHGSTREIQFSSHKNKKCYRTRL